VGYWVSVASGQVLSSADFLTVYGFRRPELRNFGSGFAVWTILSPSPRMVGAQVVPASTHFPAELCRCSLRIATMRTFPLGSCASPGSRRALRFSLKFAPSACPPHTRGARKEKPTARTLRFRERGHHEFILECTHDGPSGIVPDFRSTESPRATLSRPQVLRFE
jgi:hypothetical protein